MHVGGVLFECRYGNTTRQSSSLINRAVCTYMHMRTNLFNLVYIDFGRNLVTYHSRDTAQDIALVFRECA